MSTIIEAKELTLKYGKKPAFQNISLKIQQKQIFAIVGPSGCGKSSFLSCLNRMVEHESNAQLSGEVLFHNQAISSYPVSDLRQRISIVYQDPAPFPFSIEKNFKLVLKGRYFGDWKERMQFVLEAVDLWKEVKDRLRTPASHLSGGQQQRLCIARALALEPEVVLMDEPCSALDPLSSGVVEELIQEIGKDYTVVVVTHNLAQAKRISHRTAFFWWCYGAGCLMEEGETRRLFLEPRSPETLRYIQSERV